ncbi:uncharacterized protein LOC116501190 [Aythya fuligula]|uniref:Uncharacterized protein LOC116501190 n=1 Tax=Aythya fuligula TaxID=219594 RepID=A0A6J3EKY2_AYTFU|nr:uncharacterized protein LOC116501190 [Aythya fuligula]
MRLRSGRQKPYEVPVSARQLARRKPPQCNRAPASGTSVKLPVFSLRETVKCYLLTEDSKTVHFDLDEDGHHEISTKDSQSHEDIAWLSIFTSNEPAVSAKTWSKNVVVLTQRSKHNEFVLLCKGKKQLCLKVLKGCCSEPDYPSVKRRNRKTCKHEDPDFEQLSEDNHFFIMHSEGESVKFQCYEDTNYFLHVNDDSLDIRKPDHKDPNGEKNFFFRVSYL